MRSDLARRLSLGLWILTIAGGCTRSAPVSVESGVIPHAIDPTQILPGSPDVIALGQTAYQKECLSCHGDAGDGLGSAAYLLFPRPRDFTTGQFRLFST